MAYTPTDLVIDDWAAPIEISGSDGITNLDETVNAIMAGDPGSLHVYINAEMAKIPPYLTSELTKIGDDVALISEDAAASAAAALVSENAAAASAAEAAASAASIDIEHGTYTPIISGHTNVDTTFLSEIRFTRIGNIVTVTGTISIDVTLADTRSNFNMSLPIASFFATQYKATGSLQNISTVGVGRIVVGSILSIYHGNEVVFSLTTQNPGNASYPFTFTYEIE